MSDNDIRRDKIRQKVADSQADLAKSAVPQESPPEGVKALVMDYPFAILLGGLAIGVAAGAMFPKAKRKSAERGLSRKALAAAAVAGELGLSYGKQALQQAREAAATAKTGGGKIIDVLGERLEELSSTVGDLATDASKRAGDISGSASDSTREAGMRIVQQVAKLTSQLRH